jgi:hypothetical protein
MILRATDGESKGDHGFVRWPRIAQRGPTMEREARRDRSVLALLEVGAAGLLIAAFFLPWYQFGGQDVAGLTQSGITMDLLLAWFLIPLGTAAVVGATLVGFALPGRGAVVATLVAFGASGLGVALRLFNLISGDRSGHLEPPGPARGLWLFAAAAAMGTALATIDLVRAGSSTFVWRALGEPSTRRIGLFLAWACVIVVAFAVALFPMFPRWWLVAPVAVLLAPLLIRARRAR